MRKLLLLTIVLLTTALTAFAQVTTSALSGKVTIKETNEEVIGATVQVTHVPSGTRYMAVTNIDGIYTIRGMRTGGPYSVVVSYIGFEPKTINGVMLQLGETYDLPVWISENPNELKEVVVSGKASKFAAEKTGASTNINNQMIANLPMVNRSITEVTRLSPYGGNGMSFGGTDGRTANFTVDGANFNNNFGLNDKLPGGGNPISLDAIEEMQVVISPYDVRQTNFIGGGVNAITKSGTNTYKGTAYVYHQNENMRGDVVDGNVIDGARDRDQKTTYGFSLGGPIIKNKLFFFTNGEMIQIPTVANRWRASTDGSMDAQNYLSRTTIGDLQTVSNFVRNKYGYDTGSYTDFPADEKNYKFLIRLDWNITDKHHLAARYNYTKNTIWNAANRTSMQGGTQSAYARFSEYSMGFANSMYSMDNIVHSFSLDLNSRFSDKLSNQFLMTFSKLDDIRGSNSDEFPFIDILDGTGNTINYMALGYELFTWNNAVHNTIWNIKDDVTYYMGNHKIMGGFSYEHNLADNQFMRMGTGYYRYLSMNDFLTGATPEIVGLTYGYGGETEPAARVQYSRAGIYAQDDWRVNDKLKLTLGLRFDGIFFNNKDLMTNQAIYDLDYNGRHIDTGTWPNSKISFSPRFGFTYDVFGDKSLKVRGGTGLFEGRLPLVFFTNMPTNSGMVQNTLALNNKTKPFTGYTGPTYVNSEDGKTYIDMSQFAGGLVTDGNGHATAAALRDKLISLGYPATITPDKGTVPSSISAVDPDFRMPQVWKTSLAVDYQIPVSFPLSVTVEGIYNKNINATTISDWSMLPVEGFSHWKGADNRPIFPSSFRTNTKAFMLENTSKGYSWTANITVNAQPAEWVSLMAAYTHTKAKEITGLPGNQAESAFTYVPTYAGPNNILLHNSQYVTPDRFILSATAHDKCGNHYSLIYETWRGGYKYSYMLANDMNGDGYNYDAIYVPTDADVAGNFDAAGNWTGKGNFRFASADDQQRFMDYVHGDSYLSDNQGSYAEGYSVYSPWVHRIDYSYKHDFKFNVGKTKHMLQLSFDVKNVLNFFNSSWGVSKYMNPDLNEGRILKFDKTDAEGYPVFSTPAAVNPRTEKWVYNRAVGQCWYASIGLRYVFN